MTLISKDYVSSDIIDVLKLTNDTYLKARNFADNGDINVVKVDVNDKIVFGSVPQVTADPSEDNDLMRKSYLIDGVTGKVKASMMLADIMQYKSAWDASTNTPTLADATGDIGDVYRASVAGTQNLGSGNQTWAVGDLVIYNSSGVWEKVPAPDAVTSVNGQTGVVTLTTTNIAEGTNLYFTEARVRSTPLTGLSSAFGDLAATDTILQGFNKLNGNYLSRLNRPTLLSPITGSTTEYSTIQAALNAIPAATDAATSKQVYTLFIPSGTYDEAVTYASNNRRVIIVCLGTVTIGNMTGSAWGAGGTPRDFTIANDGTATVNGMRTGTMICSIGGIGDGFSTHQAYLTSKFRVSGNLVLSAAVGISSEFAMSGIEVFGNLDTSGYSGNCNVYLKNSRIRGTAGSSAMRLQRAMDCQFDGLVTTAVLGLYRDSNFAAGFTTSSASGDFTFIGFYNCTITGTYTGPASSAKFNGDTNYWFVANAATLAGGATKVILTNIGVSVDPEELDITVSAQNVTDGWFELAYAAVEGSVNVYPDGGPRQKLGVDYTISYTGGTGSVTRITPIGTWATIFMVAGKTATVSYLKA